MATSTNNGTETSDANHSPDRRSNNNELEQIVVSAPLALTYGSSREPPPSYEECTNPDMIPSYESLFTKVKEARERSFGIIHFFILFIGLLCGTMFCTITLGICVVLPAAMLIIASIHYHDCNVDHIPLLMFIGGIVWSLKSLLDILPCCQTRIEDNANGQNRRKKPYEPLFDMFYFCWFISMCVLVYRNYEPNYTNPSDPRYCHPTLYLFAFWYLNTCFILVGILVFCAILVYCIASRYANSANTAANG